MRIGLDFDNTIVRYDALFHTVAVEQGHIPATVAVNKNAVRDYLREAGREPIWTAMQGYVYGARMQEAEAYPDAIAVMEEFLQAGHELFIISHKTKTPYAGPAYDLHAAARQWIGSHVRRADATPILSQNHVYFHETKDEKIARIAELECEIFLDDLPEILLHKKFPSKVKKYLFSSEKPMPGDWLSVASWREFSRVIA